MFARLRSRAAASVGLVVLALSACTDRREITAPAVPSKIMVGPGSPWYPGHFINPFLPALTDFVEISAGSGHTCARRFDGRTYCWGLSDFYQAGTGGGGRCSSGRQCVDRPTLIFTGSHVDAGYQHTCALDPGGFAYCWGNGQSGEVGAAPGEMGIYSSPTAVYGGLAFTSISAGQYQSCGISNSTIFCWGNSATTPIQIASGYTSVAAGWGYGCALRLLSSTAGAVDCWGDDVAGQAGGTTSWVAPMGQTQVGGAATGVVAELTTTCVDQINGTVQCFGNNWNSQLGDGQSGAGTNTPVPQTVGGGMALHGVSVSSYHACALDPNGNAYCWGMGSSGELGNNTYPIQQSWPVAVAGGHVFRAIAAGDSHTCAISTDNHIWCWGFNGSGALGTPNTPTYTPVPVQAIDPTT